ncbi:MAG TPA: copper chaperone PCu(A)C, partial [Gammaproteobacteria bacterium]|nr:copper chaperone PCu(A)C [Gammaproteobacteria bacterium]
SPNGAVYLTLTNHGAHPDKLLGASAEIAERVEVHSHILEDGMMKMRRVDSVILPPMKMCCLRQVVTTLC